MANEFVMGARLDLGGNFSKGMSDAANSTEQFKQTTDATKDAVGQLSSQTNQFSQTANTARQATSGLTGATQDFANAMHGADDAVNDTSASANSANGIMGKLKAQFSSVTSTMQTFAKTKITNVINQFKTFKTKLTDGKSGAAGLLAALKNVGKASFTALHNGIKKIGQLAVSAGATVTKALGGAVKGAAKGLATAITGAVAGITAAAGVAGAALVRLGKQALELSNENTRMNTQLAISAANMGIDESGIQAIKDQAAALSKTTMYSSAAMTGAAAELATYFDDEEAIVRMMSTVTDYAAGMSGGVELTTEQIVDYTTNLAKMTTGAYDAMTKKGFEVTEAQKEILENGTDMQKVAVIEAIIAENWEGMAEAFANTPQGKITQFKNAWDDMKASLGDRLYPMVGEVFGYLSDCLPMVQGYLEGIADGAIGIASNLLKAFKDGGIVGAVGEVGNILADLVTKAAENAPKAVELGVTLIENLLAGIQNNASSIAKGVAKTITSFVNGVVRMLPQVLLLGADLIVNLAQGLIENLPLILQTAADAITTFVTGVVERLPMIIETAIQLVQTLVDGLISQLPLIIQSAITLITSLLQGIVSMLPAIIQAALQLIQALVQGLIENLPLIIQAAVQLIVSLIEGIVGMLPAIIQTAIQLIITIFQGLIENLPMIIEAAVQIVISLAVGLIQAIPQLIAAIPQLIAAIVDTILNTNWLDVGWQIVKGIGSGLVGGIKSLFGFGKDNGEAAAEGTIEGLEANLAEITDASSTAADALTAGFEPDYSVFTDYGAGAAASLTDGINSGSVDALATANNLAAQVTDASSAEMAFSVSMADTSAMDDFKESVETSAASVTESLSALEAEVDSNFSQIVQTFDESTAAIVASVEAVNLFDSGVAIMQGLNRGINSMRATLLSTARGIANSIKTEINSALDIHSPSRVTETAGEFTGEGLVVGIRNMIDKVRSAAYDLGDSAAEPFSRSVGTASSISPTSTPTPSPSGRGGLVVTIEKLILENVGDKDPQQLVNEIMQLLYEKLAEADDVLSGGEMGVLL